MGRIGEVYNGRLCIEKSKEKMSYIDRMILSGNVNSLLKVAVRCFDNTDSYSYDLEGKYSLEDVAAGRSLGSLDLEMIFSAICRLQQELREFLLDRDRVILLPEYIYFDSAGNKYRFCYYPEYEGNFAENIERVAEYLMENVDNDDTSAQNLAYGFYELVCQGDFNPEHIQKNFDVKPEPDEGLLSSEIVENPVETENFYYREEEEEEEKLLDEKTVKPLVAGAAVTVAAGVLYMVMFINSDLLSYVGISKEDYLVAGAVLGFVLVMILLFIVEFYIRRRRLLEMKQQEEEEQKKENAIPAGSLEWEEFMDRSETASSAACE